MIGVLPPFTVWFIAATTLLCASLSFKCDWKTQAGRRILLIILVLAGLMILYDNGSI